MDAVHHVNQRHKQYVGGRDRFITSLYPYTMLEGMSIMTGARSTGTGCDVDKN